jgi:hypothetical protein
MRQTLTERGFDFDSPRLHTAWTAFTDFVRVPLNGLVTVTFGAEFSQCHDRDDVLWASFMRRVESTDGSGWSSGCLLSRTAPRELLGVQQSRWWWAEHGTIEQWMSDVERMPEFGTALALNEWKWEGFSA